MADFKTLVIGTTDDYIAWIRGVRSQKVLFLTDKTVWSKRNPKNQGPDELIGDLSDHAGAQKLVQRHLSRLNQRLDAVVCFDCLAFLLTDR